jgi:arylsulfatase A-like enzyme/predicted O-methyltransferase YrrM
MELTGSLSPLSKQIAEADKLEGQTIMGRRFSQGVRPVIRWIKGDGLDDQVTRAAIAQATRIFGETVDYCLCTNGINADRARTILEWADQPVEWFPVTADDNPMLSNLLSLSGCQPEHYGYWWKWFPERVRLNAPEWIIDGDMVITDVPVWFQDWVMGRDVLRVSQDDLAQRETIYGNYAKHLSTGTNLYSGLVSLPPKLTYMNEFASVLTRQPLNEGHDGRREMCEQGVVAAAFQKLGAEPIPLFEFPFARAFESEICYGKMGNVGHVWGYHFGNAFRMHNPHFERLTSKGVIDFKPSRTLIERFRWLGNFGQWGVPGWSMPDACAKIVCLAAKAFIGKRVLELGTSRGQISAMLATMGCHVTTVDHQDRGALQNLSDLGVSVIQQDVIDFLVSGTDAFDFIVVDLHGNTPEDWSERHPLLLKRLAPHGMLAVNNVTLYETLEWKEETGVQWFLEQLPANFRVERHIACMPGMAFITSSASLPAHKDCASTEKPRKNLLVVHLESISWQLVHAFKESFPNLHRIASQSQRFNSHISSASSTQMVMASLLHGNDFELDVNTSLASMKLSVNNPSLFTHLNHAGYSTKFFALNAFHDDEKPILRSLSESLPSVQGGRDFASLFDDAVQFLDHQPFAMYFWNITTHIEQIPTLSSHGIGLDEQVKGALSKADHALGMLFDELDNRQLLSNTMIVLFGDHGDDYWTHGFQGGFLHATAPYFPIVHTPLLIYDSSLNPATHDTLVSSIDILPTCLQLMGLDYEPTFRHSGQSALFSNRQYAFSQNLLGHQFDSDESPLKKTFSVTDQSYHLMVSRNGLELYSHRLDPSNHCNLLQFFTFHDEGTLKFQDRDQAHLHFHAALARNLHAQSDIVRRFKYLRHALMSHVDQKRHYLESKGIATFDFFDNAFFFKIKN